MIPTPSTTAAPSSSGVIALPPPQSEFSFATLAFLGLGFIGLLLFAPLIARLLCRLCRLEKPNYKKTIVPSAVGIGFLLVAAVTFGVLSMTAAPLASSAPVFLLTTAGFGFLGLFDDLYGTRSVGGFRGHLKSLLSPRPTTGALKLIGGGFVALAASYFLNGPPVSFRPVFVVLPVSLMTFLVDAAVIALSANAVNLLDLRPGRAQFGFIALCVPTAWAVFRQGLGWIEMHPPAAVLLGPVALAALTEWWPDSSGRAMMGDTGANLLGAAAGLAAVTALPLGGRIALLAFLLGLNLLAEKMSISALIARTPWLKTFDGWLGAR